MESTRTVLFMTSGAFSVGALVLYAAANERYLPLLGPHLILAAQVALLFSIATLLTSLSMRTSKQRRNVR